LIQEFLWVGDLPVAVLKPATNQAVTPDLYYLHADHLGTPRKITRPNDNKVVWTWESEAFGNSLLEQNSSGLASFVFNLRLPGQYYDAETGEGELVIVALPVPAWVTFSSKAGSWSFAACRV
jgi:hypothetical protein